MGRALLSLRLPLGRDRWAGTDRTTGRLLEPRTSLHQPARLCPHGGCNARWSVLSAALGLCQGGREACGHQLTALQTARGARSSGRSRAEHRPAANGHRRTRSLPARASPASLSPLPLRVLGDLQMSGPHGVVGTTQVVGGAHRGWGRDQSLDAWAWPGVGDGVGGMVDTDPYRDREGCAGALAVQAPPTAGRDQGSSRQGWSYTHDSSPPTSSHTTRHTIHTLHTHHIQHTLHKTHAHHIQHMHHTPHTTHTPHATHTHYTDVHTHTPRHTLPASGGDIWEGAVSFFFFFFF